MGRQVRRAAPHDRGGPPARAAHLHGGPHIDGEHPAYPADSVVARDPEEARRQAESNVRKGASALKIYFRLPFASAKAVIEVCNAHHIPCTAHLEILDARELIAAGLHGIEHVTSLGTSVVPRSDGGSVPAGRAGRQRRPARRAIRLFADADLDGPEARRSTPCCARTSRGSIPRWRFSSAARIGAEEGAKPEMVPVMAAGFAKMKQLARRAGLEGARLVMGGHSTVPLPPEARPRGASSSCSWRAGCRRSRR